MSKSVSQFQEVKAVFRQKNQSRYKTLREALRILIPYEWRRRAVNFIRRRIGQRALGNWARAKFARERFTPPGDVSFRRDDYYETITLRPNISDTNLETILRHQAAPVHRAQPDVICFSIVDWSFRFQRPQQLMAQFAARGHRTFYLNVSQFRSVYAQPKFAVREIRENLIEVQIAARSQLSIYHRAVEGEELEFVMSSLDELRSAYNINEAIGYVMIPSWGKAARAAQQSWGWRIIYDCMDEWENFPGISPLLTETEKQLVLDCDLLVVTGKRLYDKWQKFQRPTVLARNATDYDFYAERCKSNDLLPDTQYPMIGYFGAIADWFDIDLMADIAELRPNFTFVLLGGVFDVDVSRLRVIPNVILLGQKPYESMPQYLHHFDACIIPFKINSITEATDPVKLYEYLSGGKPVVSVNLPELEPHRNYVYIANGAADFAEKLDLAITENNQELIERRKELARRHTWAERYKCIFNEFIMTTPRTSIIIVTYNNLVLTRLCLESIFKNTEYPNYEVIIVDNNSNDGTQSYLQSTSEKHDNLIIILNRINDGFAKATNQGIRKAKGAYLVLLNNDTIVPQGWLSRLLMHLRDPAAGLVGPVTNFVGNEAKIDADYSTWAEMESFARDYMWRHHRLVADIQMLSMFCLAMRKEVFEKVGPLDEQFGLGMFEDDDYSLRVRQHGYRVICAADTFVHHFGQAAFGKLIRSGDYDRIFDENRRKFERKWDIEWKPHRHSPLNFELH
ncbi:MAG: glycosyltransferase [Acidobacteria bacterium]|nr:glycosyltransferase [Acidobacteriota bacterium]